MFLLDDILIALGFSMIIRGAILRDEKIFWGGVGVVVILIPLNLVTLQTPKIFYACVMMWIIFTLLITVYWHYKDNKK